MTLSELNMNCSLKIRVAAPRLTNCRHATGWLMGAVFALMLLLGTPQVVHPQKGDFFSVSSIMRDVKIHYKLDRRDVRRLGPLIENENCDVLMIYVRFGGSEPEYSRAIWRDLVARRIDFEARLDVRLTARQRSALRSARAALERRALEFLLDDYIFFVSDILELDGLELEAIEHLFSKEIMRKHLLVLKYLRQPILLQSEMEKVTLETDTWLVKILTPEQLRVYRNIASREDNLIG